MSDIALALIQSNPYRNFDLHPIDQEQVEKLKASITADGFWASVVARPFGKDYQIAFGHHRIEAARQLGLREVPIEVRELSEWQMVRMLASENATQRGSTAAACLDAVAAMSQVLAYTLLRCDEAMFGKKLPNVGVSYPECRGRLDAGQGIGRACIMGFAPAGAFTEPQVRAALGTLKDSGLMGDIISAARAKAEAELQVEQEAAEQELRDAEDRQRAAKNKSEKDAAAKATRKAKGKAAKTKRAAKATTKAATAAKRQPITYDARCAQLFKLDSHAQTFRQIVTSETFQSYLPLAQQYDFAQKILAAIRANGRPGKEITATDIRMECWSQIETGLGMAKGKLRTAPERPFLQEIRDGLNFIRRGANDYRRGVALLLDAQFKGERLDATQRTQLAKHHALFEQGMQALKPVQDAGKLKLVGEDSQ